ncbi:MAG: CaiB/BaiF CoA-transferase family protein [Rhodospirillales bacterium]|jgi:crotonobetainyl-CoA:carnitine CoA-transferase CaiB-like acyl-CoA transferase|nr:CoA transferase [Rhodospirillaceae bacterium]MDP6430222.1 CaiB/BaiF CoA-transferase family protein [Rhodospirillales bacterium]MDP6646211.1 CaiB/BaiF CoA-transferase family protein [Rhodospirillales bacterium]MDP6840129.1 CaiB/BaiF CoA-transferase family protein [Rhodospirillales bacterium]
MAEELESQTGLLAGIRVIEFSHVMAAPTCGLMLADMGADVIKVERLPGGDNVRGSAPFAGDVSAPFTMMNRGKRGVALNLKTEAGKAVLKRLVEGADVFFENYRMGAADHYGVGYDALKESCPRLVYCSLSGFGRTGPYRMRGGFDLVAQGMSGLMSITGEGPGRPPVKVGAPVTDITAGILAAMGILGALVKRAASGRGQFVDTSLFEAGITHTYWQSAIYMASGQLPQAMGSAHPLMAPYQAFETKDGWINLGSANQKLWLKLVELLGAPELADDPRFEGPNQRRDNHQELAAALAPYFRAATTDHWFQRLDAAGIPAGPVLDIKQMTEDAQTNARDMVQEVGGEDGAIRVLGHPVKYSENPAHISRPAPRLGEHTVEVLAEAGYTADEIKGLKADGAIGTAEGD